MTRSESARLAAPTSRGRRWAAAALVVLLVAGGATAWQLGYAEQWWDRWTGEDPVAGPAGIAPPPAVDLPPVSQPDVVARPATTGLIDPAAVARALGDYFRAPDIGPHVLAAVAPLRGAGGAEVRVRGKPLAIPASTTKVVTSAVALSVLGGDHRFTTRTTLDTSTPVPRVVLVGGGDPYLTSEPHERGTSATFDLRGKSITTLAKRTARKLKRQGIAHVSLGYDATLFSGPSGQPTWRAYPALDVDAYIESDLIAPISALWVDQGRELEGWGRADDPPRAAAGLFAQLLRERGVAVDLAGPATSSASARELVVMRSAPLSQVVRRLLEVSDNAAAEVLLRHIGLAVEGEGSFAAGATGVRRTLAAHGIEMGDSILYDGSGLSRSNRLTPALLIEVIQWVADPDEPGLRPVLTSLPVAGFTGSLANRMDEGPPIALGRVRAKTGTLTGVSSLAGIVIDRDGTPMAFVLMADRIPEDKDLDARKVQDRAAAALAACRCAG